ncbi:MAG: heavy metal-binding domain-containing protein [Acidobacteriota bacterium]
MKKVWFAWGLITAMAILPRGVLAQCGDRAYTGGGHDHDRSGSSGAASRQVADIRSLLSEEASRQAMMDAIVADAPFMRELIARIVELPEWRALALERLGMIAVAPSPKDTASVDLQPPAQAAAPDRAVSPAAPSAQQAVYRCPMHPEITSDRPGDCPKCGMTLERVD